MSESESSASTSTFTRGQTPEPVAAFQKRRKKPQSFAGRPLSKRKQLHFSTVSPNDVKRVVIKKEEVEYESTPTAITTTATSTTSTETQRTITDAHLTTSSELMRTIKNAAALYADEHDKPALYQSMDRSSLVAAAILVEEALKYELGLED